MIVIYLRLIFEDVVIMTADSFPLIQSIALSYSSSIIFWMKALGVPIIDKFRPSYVLMAEVIITDSSAVAYYVSMVPHCLLSPFNILTLTILYLF